jgi:hypothetical protein
MIRPASVRPRRIGKAGEGILRFLLSVNEQIANIRSPADIVYD